METRTESRTLFLSLPSLILTLSLPPSLPALYDCWPPKASPHKHWVRFGGCKTALLQKWEAREPLFWDQAWGRGSCGSRGGVRGHESAERRPRNREDQPSSSSLGPHPQLG